MQFKKAVSKPLPLKQRTSSVDNRRDFNAATWYSVLSLLKVREYFVTVDHYSIWRRHLAWAFEDGKALRDYMTQRYASSMIFLSLLLSTELQILFSSSEVTSNMRYSLQNEQYWNIKFWIGITVICSAVLTLLALITTLTTWNMVSAVNENNAHAIFRSSIGQYIAELPGRLIVGSIYSFLLWLVMFFFVLLPVGFWSIALGCWALALFLHTIMALSSFGRIIMHSGAMAKTRIFDPSYERNLLPHSLHFHLLAKSKLNLSKNTSILRQYRVNSKPIDHCYSEEELSQYLEADSKGIHPLRVETPAHNKRSFPSDEEELESQFHETNFQTSRSRKRTDSVVRFSEEVDMVTSSPLGSSPKFCDDMHSVGDAETPVPQTSKMSPESLPDDLLYSRNEGNGMLDLPLHRGTPRPGIVSRGRPDTEVHGGNPLSYSEAEKIATPSEIPSSSTCLPDWDEKSAEFVAAEGSKTANNLLGRFLRLSMPSGTAKEGIPSHHSSTTYHSPQLLSSSSSGLSVLENASRLQMQYRNSYTSGTKEHTNQDNSRRSSFPSTSLVQQSAIQELWTNPDQKSSASTRPLKQPLSAAKVGAADPTRSPTTQTSWARGGTRNNRATSLSEEDEEAYKRDYGSFEGLPLLENKEEDDWKGRRNTNEQMSLLRSDRMKDESPF